MKTTILAAVSVIALTTGALAQGEYLGDCLDEAIVWKGSYVNRAIGASYSDALQKAIDMNLVQEPLVVKDIVQLAYRAPMAPPSEEMSMSEQIIAMGEIFRTMCNRKVLGEFSDYSEFF